MSEMTIQCPLCSQLLTVETEWAGMEIECPLCKGEIRIPQFSVPPAHKTSYQVQQPHADEEELSQADDCNVINKDIEKKLKYQIISICLLSIIVIAIFIIGMMMAESGEKGFVARGWTYLLTIGGVIGVIYMICKAIKLKKESRESQQRTGEYTSGNLSDFLSDMEDLVIDDDDLMNIDERLEAGGRFVCFKYCYFNLVLTVYGDTGKIFFINPGESTWQYSWKYTILSLLTGWIGLGIFILPGVLFCNFRGGKDVTAEVLDCFYNQK